jgi:cytochrome d ubiquinol oxidase subunit II
MGTLWFCHVALMIGMYVVLDGFDLGAGIIHFLAGRTGKERGQVLRTIGPVWDGNEVWLLAAGGILYFAFPMVYASAFSGFYQPLMILLWLLIIRAVSIEFRHHLQGPILTPFWDAGFAFASVLIAIFLGAALGNVVRGVPLDGKGYFFMPLWTDFSTGPAPGILDWYTVLVALTALFTLAHHGALWVALKAEGPVGARARALARPAWWGPAVLAATITACTFQIQPQVSRNLAAMPWGYLFPALAAAGLAGASRWRRSGRDLPAFLSSCLFILGMLLSCVFGLYPLLLPASNDPGRSLTVSGAQASAYGLGVGYVWWVAGMALVTGYFIHMYRSFRGKVSAEGDGY